MKKAVLAIAFVAGLAGIVAIGSWLIPAPDVTAAPRCTQTFSTAQVTGVSTVDCPWAVMDAQMKAEALIPCDDTCFENLVIIDDNNCQKFWPSGEFRVVARIDYQCELNIEIPPM